MRIVINEKGAAKPVIIGTQRPAAGEEVEVPDIFGRLMVEKGFASEPKPPKPVKAKESAERPKAEER